MVNLTTSIACLSLECSIWGLTISTALPWLHGTSRPSLHRWMPRDSYSHRRWRVQFSNPKATISSAELFILGCWKVVHLVPKLLAPVRALLLLHLSGSSCKVETLSQRVSDEFWVVSLNWVADLSSRTPTIHPRCFGLFQQSPVRISLPGKLRFEVFCVLGICRGSHPMSSLSTASIEVKGAIFQHALFYLE